MEIVDDQQRVILQEEYIQDNLMIMRGDIQYENFTFEAGLSGGWPSTIPHIMIGGADLHHMFLYPFERHPNKRNPNYAP
jgi:hypothetical protein